MQQWADKINGNPLRFRVEKWFWVVMIVVAISTGLINSVAFVSFLSIYALVLTLAGAEQAAEARTRASEGNATPAEIADHLVTYTSIESRG
jgi:predicted CDP-diglyceride synthetase/phosphatidate cytidylyltransferase